MTHTDAVVIGGGPAGSATATLLARQGFAVSLFEKQTFPRFHIGESLLPGSIPFLEELGVHDEVRRCSVKKPGGKWYYGHRPVFSDFACGEPNTSFADTPYAYMVKREQFDDILLRNAEKSGARVFHQHTVTDVLQEDEKVVGVTVKDDQGATHDFRSEMVFDCSGYGALIPRKFKLRRENRLKRMAVFGHYKTTPVNPDLRDGWFVGQMIYDGWIWMIPLEPELISIGVVVTLDEYRNAKQSPREFLEGYMRKMPVVKAGIAPDPELQGDVHLYGNLGYTTTRAHGPGWALVGDAAFFIDPCYSSGVHLALTTARAAARTYAESRGAGVERQTEAFAEYERDLRRDEKLMLRFVDSFYMASRNRVLKWLVPATLTDSVNRSFVAVTAGEFAKRPYMINGTYLVSKLVSSVFFPFRAHA